jgi:peptidoglycan/LPS O-acetylase OafA/YrhL
MSNKKILYIEKLRGLSIVLVLLFHLEVPGFAYGYFGVDIFFVISGFLMATLYGDISKPAEIKNYFLRRCSRILPAYYTVIALTIITSCFLLLPHEIDMVMKQSIWSAFLLPNFGFWTDAAYFDHTLFRPLLNLWSLGVEVQFYLLFPLLLAIWRRSTVFLMILSITSLLEYGVLTFIDPTTAFFLIPGRIWEFMLGFYAAKYRNVNPVTCNKIGLSAIVLLLVLIMGLANLSLSNTYIVSTLVVLLTGIAITYGFSTGAENSPLSLALVTLGKYSYSIYLVHFPLIVFANYLPFEGTKLGINNTGTLAVTVLAIVFLSFVLFQAIELRTRTLFSGRQLGVFALSFGMVVLLISEPATRLNMSRLGPDMINISRALNDRDSFECVFLENFEDLFSASCGLNNPASESGRRFLLAGDSHADVIKRPLADLLESNGQTLRLMKGKWGLNQQIDGSEVILEALRQNVGVIILHSLPQPDNGDALAQFVSKAQSLQLKVAFIAPVPNYSFDIPKKLFENLSNGGGRIFIGGSLADYLDKNRLLFENLEYLAEHYSNFSWYRSSDFLCDFNCYLSSTEMKPYYFDTNHLTLTGAALLKPIYESISLL